MGWQRQPGASAALHAHRTKDATEATMPEPAEDMIIRNLIESLERLRSDIDRMELWAAALGSFRHPAPDYQPSDRHLLKPPEGRSRSARS
jgi:hypothetical protein